MSSTPAPPAPPARLEVAPRVRDRAREALHVMAFSALCSAALALVLLIATHLLSHPGR